VEGKLPQPAGSEAERVAGGEIAAIERIHRTLPLPPSDEVWIGDDAAVLRGQAGPLLVSVDLTVGGVHADLELVSVSDLGWKALASSVSDMAAMGGRPERIVVAVAAPSDTDLDQLYEGIRSAAAFHECTVVGGDLSSADEIVVSVTVCGGLRGPLSRGPVLRSGAGSGDALLVTRPLGRSAAGLRLLRRRRAAGSGASGTGEIATSLEEAHRRPVARILEGEVARLSGATAMIDLSDGLTLDVRRLAKASQVGVQIESLPVAEGATEEEALSGGEDYELMIAAPDASELARAFADAGLPAPIEIGHCTADREQRTFMSGPLPEGGYQHSFGR
jgi:thiamine-monophosphate kinase